MAKNYAKENAGRMKKFLDAPYVLLLVATAISVIVNSEFLTLAIFLAILIIYAKKEYDSRIPIAFGLLLLVSSAIELAFANDGVTNSLAIYSLYYLIAGVLLQLIEYIRNPDEPYEN